jgi:hypothetical protein
MAAGLRVGVAILVAAVTASMLMLPVWLLPPSAGLATGGDPVGTGVEAAIVAGLIASAIVFVALRHGHLKGL